MYLRQSTSATINIGPFVDATDGVTEETGLAGSMTVRLSKAGGIFAARNSGAAIAHDTGQSGHYRVPIDTVDTATVGELKVAVQAAATHLPVFARFTVLPATVYDSLVAGTDKLQVDLREVQGRATLWSKTWDTVFAAIASVVAGRRTGGDHKSPTGVTEETIVAATVTAGDRTAATWTDPA